MSVDGKAVDADVEKGYAVIKEWNPGDVVTLDMAMPVEIMESDPRVKENVGKRAIQRGPLVYCIEEVDNATGFDSLHLNDSSSFEVADAPDLLGGVKVIKAKTDDKNILFVPYYAWDNRSAGKMKVWLEWK